MGFAQLKVRQILNEPGAVGSFLFGVFKLQGNSAFQLFNRSEPVPFLKVLQTVFVVVVELILRMDFGNGNQS